MEDEKKLNILNGEAGKRTTCLKKERKGRKCWRERRTSYKTRIITQHKLVKKKR